MELHAPPAAYAPSLQCPHCPRKFRNGSGLTQHINALHHELTPPPDTEEHDEDSSFSYVRHTVFTGTHFNNDLSHSVVISNLVAKPCNEHGNELPAHAPAAPDPTLQNNNSWYPFEDRKAFDFAHYHFVEVETSKMKIVKALDHWAAAQLETGRQIPWKNAKEMQSTIDAIQLGDCPWKTCRIRYQGPIPAENPPKWMTQTYELCMRNSKTLLHQQIRTPDFNGKIHYAPYMQFNSAGDQIWSNLMSSDYVWDQAVRTLIFPISVSHWLKQKIIASETPTAQGAMLIPIVMGSDKTTVSVATGHQQYHPVYMSPGGITNIARRAHGNGVLPVAFLPIPKGK